MHATERYLWHVWPARHWPASAAEERAFVAELQRTARLRTNEIVPFERGDLTTVLNALRNGMTYTELCNVAPGVAPKRLLSAYRHIDALRNASVQAFYSLCTTLDEATVENEAPVASMLLPVPTFQLCSAYRSASAGHSAPTHLDAVRREVRAVTEQAALAASQHESQLATGQLNNLDAIRLGRTLYDPFGDGLWSHPFFAPPRVGTLVPARVRDLLGERDE